MVLCGVVVDIGIMNFNTQGRHLRRVFLMMNSDGGGENAGIPVECVL